MINPGDVICGFRIERSLGAGRLGVVYEATQLSLDRPVALRLIEADLLADPAVAARFAAQQRLSAGFHHRAVIPTYEVGSWERGRFVATRFVSGRTLADLLADRRRGSVPSSAALAPIAEALASAHRAGLVHGAISARTVILDADGDAHLADLGLGRRGSIEGDREALVALMSQVGSPRRRRRWLLTAAVAAAAALVAGIVIATSAGGDDLGEEAAPAVPPGTRALGSELGPGSSTALGCTAEPGPNTPACTLGQSAIAGAEIVVERDGLIRGWAVRGAAGDLTLQVIGRSRGLSYIRSFSQVESVPDRGPHAFTGNIPVRRGDRIGVVLAPGATIGARMTPDSSGLRWDGTLPFAPEPQGSVPIDQELLLRVDIEADARPALVQVRGTRAARLPDGEVLGSQPVQLPGGEVGRVTLVQLGDRVFVDAVHGGRRLARAEVAGAAAGGRVLSFEGQCGFRNGFCLRWLNPGEGEPVIHAYSLAPGAAAFHLIG